MARSSGLTGGMAPDAFIQLEGVDPIIEALDKLGAITARRIVRPAVNKALTPINKAAKGKLRPGHGRDTGALRASIGKRVVFYKRTGTIWGGVGPRVEERYWKRKGKETRRPAFYGHIVELGAAPHSLTEAHGRSKNRRANQRTSAAAARERGSGLHPGVSKMPFLRPALDENTDKAFNILGRAVFAGIDRHLAKTRSSAA